MDLPEKEILKKIINSLQNADLSRVTLSRIINILLTELKVIPYSTIILKAGSHIERARINNKDEVFISESEITYRTDFENIKHFGRANIPRQSIFYGSIKSDTFDQPLVVNLFEISELYRDRKLDSANFNITVGKWKIKEDFKVVELIHNIQDIYNDPLFFNVFQNLNVYSNLKVYQSAVKKCTMSNQ